jgi:hypothetical protein
MREEKSFKTPKINVTLQLIHFSWLLFWNQDPKQESEDNWNNSDMHLIHQHPGAAPRKRETHKTLWGESCQASKNPRLWGYPGSWEFRSCLCDA